ncbi:MAG: hypothetical protein ACI4MI_04590 [Christensenellales bacterium]
MNDNLSEIAAMALRYALQAYEKIRNNLEWCIAPDGNGGRYEMKFKCEKSPFNARIAICADGDKSVSIDAETIEGKGKIFCTDGYMNKGEHVVVVECGAHDGIYASIDVKGGEKIED